jgi:hypothetical protein
MKKHKEARTKTPVRILCAGYGFVEVDRLLYISDPNIIEHMRIAKMSPKGNSVIRQPHSACQDPCGRMLTLFGAC